MKTGKTFGNSAGKNLEDSVWFCGLVLRMKMLRSRKNGNGPNLQNWGGHPPPFALQTSGLQPPTTHAHPPSFHGSFFPFSWIQALKWLLLCLLASNGWWCGGVPRMIWIKPNSASKTTWQSISGHTSAIEKPDRRQNVVGNKRMVPTSYLFFLFLFIKGKMREQRKSSIS